MFTPGDLDPEYLTDPRVLLCPADEEVQARKPEVSEDVAWYFDHNAYWYLGYAVTDEQTGLAFAEAYRQRTAAGLGFEEAYLDGSAKKIPRLQEGVERFFITDIHNPKASADAQARIPILIERPGMHGDSINVLFMDGHAERMQYPGKFPASERFIEALKTIDAIRKPEADLPK